MIGFSLGGAIMMYLGADYPYLINRIVLLGPGGILRRLPAEYGWFCFRYPWLFSKHCLKRRVGQVLGVRLDPLRDDVGQNQIALREEKRLKGRDHDKTPGCCWYRSVAI